MVEWVHYQLVGEDAPQVPMDPPEFMLAPLSMTVAKYALWRHGTAYVDRVREELDYDEFNYNRLIPPLLSRYAPSFYLFSFLLSFFAFSNMMTLK